MTPIPARPRWRRAIPFVAAAAGLTLLVSGCSGSGETSPRVGGGEASLELPDLGSVTVLGFDARWCLVAGLVVCLVGLAFGALTYRRLKKLWVHQSMEDISELIYSTCKAYLVKQAKFLLMLWCFIAVVIIVYYAAFVRLALWKVGVIIGFSLLGMAGSFGIAWFGIRVNTFANSRTAFASLKGEKWPVRAIPTRSGMSVGMVLISLELLLMLSILLFLPRTLAGSCFVGFAVGESLGAAALRIAGGIFTKIADIGADLMKIVFKIGEDDPRNPGTIADCAGDNAGDSVGPSADGFETYGVTSVALVTFTILGIGTLGENHSQLQAMLLVWIFTLSAVMVFASGLSYYLNEWVSRIRLRHRNFDFETPLTTLVRTTSGVSIVLCFGASFVLLRGNGLDANLWWSLATIVSCGLLAGALIPELVKAFTSTKSRHVDDVVVSSNEGGASLNILSGIVAGSFSAYWLGAAIAGLMGIAYLVSYIGIGPTESNTLFSPAPVIFAFGLVAFGFLGMGPVTIAVDSYGPVTDNAQSVYELSRIESLPGIGAEIEEKWGFQPAWDEAKAMLEENDGAGNTFKATAKPVLIGTAVVGATTMIFSIIITLAQGSLESGAELSNLDGVAAFLSPVYAPFLLGLIAGAAMIFWFTGASTQAVTTGAYRAVQYIKANIKLDDTAQDRASEKDSKRVVEICTTYAQKGMFTIFLAVFFATIGFAFVHPSFFIGYIISIAIVGLFQAVFMANAGGAWDNAKKVVETDLGMKGTALHDATVVGDTVGDPFKDTGSVALNPVIKFTTLFGLLTVELSISLRADYPVLVPVLAVLFFLCSAVFVWRSFYSMRIGASMKGQLPEEDDPREIYIGLGGEDHVPSAIIESQLEERPHLG
jgi:K(+)-stimulated pyrophosphate-energized sodium pump